MLHPPCDVVRLRLAELLRQELYAEAAHQRLAQRFSDPGFAAHCAALASQLRRRIGGLAGSLPGPRIALGDQTSECTPDEPAVLA